MLEAEVELVNEADSDPLNKKQSQKKKKRNKWKKGDLKKIHEVTIFSDYEVSKTDNLNNR